MDQQEIIDRLRNPAKYRNHPPHAPGTPAVTPTMTESVHQVRKSKADKILGGVVLGLLGLTVLFIWLSQRQTEKIADDLVPIQESRDFDPKAGVKYVQIQGGQERFDAYTNVGSMLPILNRFNKENFTRQNYEVIGAAPWALITNINSNITDPEIIRQLLSNEDMIQSFLRRPGMERLLADPQQLRELANQTYDIDNFFSNATVQAVLADPQLVRIVANSRFMSHLLVSPGVKYYRDRPKEALAVIRGNAVLNDLRFNPGVQQAVRENTYLKSIAEVLLSGTAPTAPAPAPAPSSRKTGRAGKK